MTRPGGTYLDWGYLPWLREFLASIDGSYTQAVHTLARPGVHTLARGTYPGQRLLSFDQWGLHTQSVHTMARPGGTYLG